VDGDTKIDNAVSTAAAGTSAGPFIVTAGNHTVSETFGDGVTPVNGDWIVTISGDCNSSTGVVTLTAGQSKQCTITNEKKPKLTVTKKIVGGNGTTDSFDVKVDGVTKIDNAVSTAAAGTSAGPFTVTAGNHTVSETFGDGTTAVNSDWIVTISGDCNSSTGVVTLAAGDSKQCTITNTKKGMAQVIKTFNGGALGANSFTFQLRSGASAGAAGTILENGTASAGNNGIINFATKLTPGTTYQMCEQMQPGWLTTLGPPLYSVFNPSGDNSIVCTDFTVNPGETKVFAINNQPPPGGMGLTIGFWKNWASCANSNGSQKPTLDRTLQLGDLLLGSLVLHDSNSSLDVASDCQSAVNLLNKTTITGGKKMSSDPIFNMVAQLVAADLNVLAGAGQSVNAMNARACAHALLVAINFNGNTYNKPLTAAQTAQANCLATQLDRYNNNLSVGTCAGCP